MDTQDRRGYPRHACLLKVRVEAGEVRLDGLVVNLSESGGFVASAIAVPLGSLVALVLRRPSDRVEVRLTARVVRVVRPGDPGERQPGFAVRFRGLLAEARPAADAPPRVAAATTRPEAARTGAPPRPGDSIPPQPPRRERTLRVFRKVAAQFHEKGRPDHRHRGAINNLSAGGLYVEAEALPLVGSVVYVEVPGLEVDGEMAPLRLSGQVKWWGSQRPDLGLPRGFGVQILAFGGPAERGRYERFVQVVLRDAGAVGAGS